MQGKLYGVGVGPGDPELITLKAINAIKNCEIIAIPKSSKESEGVAFNIVKKVLPEIQDKKILELSMPMTRDQELLKKSHQEAAAAIIEELDQGNKVVFLTLGDPTVYSTYIYIHNYVLQGKYQAEIIPGVPSFCAVAAKLNMSLVENSEPLHIIPGSYKGVTEGLKWSGTKVIMKTGKSLEKVKERLKDADLYGNAKMIERCGMDGERVFESLDETNNDNCYFSIIIAKDKEKLND